MGKMMDLAVDELSALFDILDHDRSGSISYNEFIEQIHRMRSGDTRTLLMLIKHDIMCVDKNVKDELSTVHANFNMLHQLIARNGPGDSVVASPETVNGGNLSKEVSVPESSPQAPLSTKQPESTNLATASSDLSARLETM